MLATGIDSHIAIKKYKLFFIFYFFNFFFEQLLLFGIITVYSKYYAIKPKEKNGKRYCRLKLNKIIMLIITADNYYFNTHLLTLFALSDIEKI